MKLTEEEKKICAAYIRKVNGKVNCWVCPLKIVRTTRWDFRCKKNSHYDEKEKDWIYDEF